MISDQHINEFLSLYNKLDRSNLSLLSSIYHADVKFVDPMHQINGLPQLTDYFANMYENLQFGQFEIHRVLKEENCVSVYWTMSFAHSKIKGGETVTFDGNTYLEYQEGKVIYHRDYFDGAAMLYQHIPLLGNLISLVKKRAKS